MEEYNAIDEAKQKFLQGLVDTTTVVNALKASSKTEKETELAKPVTTNSKEILSELQVRCKFSWNRESKELVIILNSLHFNTLLECHDAIALRMKTVSQDSRGYQKLFSDSVMSGSMRMVGIRKKIGEPLGLTVQLDGHGHLLVARILKGGLIEKQGLLWVGDIILEVNGIQVSKPEELQREISKTEDHVTLKVSNSLSSKFLVIPNSVSPDTCGIFKSNTCYMRSLFKYNPEQDSLLPCKELGLPFDRGDILQIVDQIDPNWWQAKKVGGNGNIGLIPSIELEERRKAFIPESELLHKISICGAKITKKMKRIVYQTRTSSNFDRDELLLYEEVTKLPPFKRKTLVLIGAQAEQKKNLKHSLLSHYPDKFGIALNDTSKPTELFIANSHYNFVERKSMEEDIKNNKYLEYFEYNGNLYGIHFDSIWQIILQGKMCIIDCNPISLKVLYNCPEFLPFVIFISESDVRHNSGRSDINNSHLGYTKRNSCEYNLQLLEDNDSLLKTYSKYIDLVLPNDSSSASFQRIMNALEAQVTEQQWVPVNWIY